MPQNEQKVSFRPRARLLSLLGEQLISDQAVGLIELVKNSYDADATLVEVTLDKLTDANTTRIIINDNGFGMSRDDIIDKWLSPAVDHKEQQKQKNNRTSLGRLPIGEKGVGRFAVHQLGHKLTLITRSKRSREVVLEVNWDEFDSGEAYLDDLSVPLYERAPMEFTGNQTGTVLIIDEARTVWTEAQVRKVQRALRRIQSPHQNMEDFVISFRCSDYPSLENISPSDVTERWHYRFRGTVDEFGMLDYEYQCRLPGIPERRHTDDNNNLTPGAINELSGLLPTCGRFAVNFYVWDRTPEYLRASEVSTADLNAMTGVALFRDGLRVLPYGESGNDWLDLDRERINDPGKRIGNQQIIGFIEVQQSDTPQLRDKTNREGLIENDAFRDLRALIRATLNVFISQWLNDRPGKHRPAPKQTESGAIGRAKNIASAVASTARDDVLVNINRNSPPAKESGVPLPSEKDDVAGEPLDIVNPLSQREAINLLISHLDDAESHEKQSLNEQARREETLMHLASTGMVAERVSHEFGRQVKAALDAIIDLRPLVNGDKGNELLSIIDTCLGTLRNEFHVLAPYDINWRLQRTSLVNVGETAELSIKLNEMSLKEISAEFIFEGKDFEVKARPASLTQVFDNLLNNACIWLQTMEQNERIVGIHLDPSNRSVLVADNGPGVPAHLRESIFEPFVSLRNGGRGLGLYITREILSSIGATIELVDPPEWADGHGAAFLIKF